jgi:hypothetical protein
MTLAIVVALAGGCASSSGSTGGATTPAGPTSRAGAVSANLAGSRCHGATCACRDPRGPAVENPPPDEGHKRFEVRLAALEGSASLSSPTLGDLSSSGDEVCYYIDVVPGTTHDVTFVAREGRPEGGVGPTLAIAEYGPKGPWWYDVINVHCAGPEGKCNRDAADEWGADIKKRKRGRIDPCGSSVVTHLTWDTSGGGGARELGLFRDLTVKFTMEVKKFATQFAPGSTECVPK